MTELSYWKLLTRRKTISDTSQHPLPKASKRIQLPNIGISTSFGIGIFAIIGFVARNVAGPSVIVCIGAAALISFLSGIFYAELSSRITRNATTYTYIYVCIGELQAFIVGWTLILEYIIGMAIASDSIGLHVDTLLNDIIKNSFKEFAPIHWSALATYFDFVAFAIPIFFAIIVNIGLKRSDFLNKIFFVISVAVTSFIVIAGAFRAEPGNWYTIPPLLEPVGFAPFGYFGIVKGIAVCVFIFVGFDVAGTGTKWKSLHGLLAFIFGTAALIGIGTVVTLAQPFYLLNEHAQLPQIFNIPSWYTAYYIIAIGGIIVLFASMCGLMFSMQITVMAMAKDSLLPKSFDGDKPVIEILGACLIAGLLAGLFRMAHLIDMLSIGIMFGFMAMAFAVVMFRYSNEYEYGSVSTIDVADSNNLPDKEEKPVTVVQIAKQLFNGKNQKKPTNASYAVVKILLVGLGLVSLGLAWLANFAYLNIYGSEVWAITVTVVLVALLIIIIFLISLQPMRKLNAIFMVPFVPLSPAISIVVNIYLMMSLHYYAWIRFGIWIIFGLIIYFICIVKYNRRTNIIDIKSDTFTKNGYKNHGFIGDIERRPSLSFNSQSQMTYKSDDLTETENENVYQSKINAFELEREIPISPKSVKNAKAPIPVSFKANNQSQTEASTSSVTKSRTPSPSGKTLDEIVLMSDVIDTLTEMKEPNGKTYFVDEIRPSVVDTLEESDQKTAIEYLDDVLKKEEVSDDNINPNVEENGISTSVIALVHLNRAVDEPSPIVIPGKEFSYGEQTITDTILEKTKVLAGADSEEKELVSEPLTVNTEGDADHKEPTTTSDTITKDAGTDTDLKETELVVVPLSLITEKDLQELGESATSMVVDGAKLFEEVKTELKVLEPEAESLDDSESSPNGAAPVVVSKPIEEAMSDSKVTNSQIITPEVDGHHFTEIKGKSTTDHANGTNNSDSEQPMTFKERLAMLLGQQPVAEVRRVSPRQNESLPQITSDSKLKHSKSETDIFNSMQGVFKDIRSKYEPIESDATNKPLPMTVTDDIPIDDCNSSVPVPPKFDPFIYKTIGSRHNARMALKIGDESDSPNSHKTPMTAPIIMDNEHNDVVLRKKSVDNDDQERMISIKDRLENIFKRGPPDRYSRPKSIALSDDVPVKVTPTKVDNDKIEESETETEEVVHFKEAKRPFDTVHKQKVLFNDVLKSIGAETRPSVIRANSMTKQRRKPETIEDARNALKRVSANSKKHFN
ncbi:uncharacterized protein LOC119075187 [Bradysia coprophila]|uniref:uncharacterized protein LOC119075187 n=1 Tax=Bradysia coprophila TaxID=38358 RepID=UPI00187D7B25|nr:uncharacterized protein LOC119075187 [Bradysia coprophila]